METAVDLSTGIAHSPKSENDRVGGDFLGHGEFLGAPIFSGFHNFREVALLKAVRQRTKNVLQIVMPRPGGYFRLNRLWNPLPLHHQSMKIV